MDYPIADSIRRALVRPYGRNEMLDSEPDLTAAVARYREDLEALDMVSASALTLVAKGHAMSNQQARLVLYGLRECHEQLRQTWRAVQSGLQQLITSGLQVEMKENYAVVACPTGDDARNLILGEGYSIVQAVDVSEQIAGLLGPNNAQVSFRPVDLGPKRYQLVEMEAEER